MENKRDDPLTDFDNLSAEEWVKLLSETILPEDFPALQRWLEPARSGLDKLAHLAAKIDLSEGWFIRGKKWELHKLILQTAKEALSREGLDTIDVRYLESNRDNFLSCLDALTTGDISEKQQQSALVAIEAAFVIGAFVNDPKTVMREMQDAQTRNMRVRKEIITAARNVSLDAAIIDMSKYLNKALAVSMNFAMLIRPGVRELLGRTHNEKGWPSESAIKEAISKRIKLQELSSRKAKTSRTVPT